jgi:small conductance mechanosensitive channel
VKETLMSVLPKFMKPYSELIAGAIIAIVILIIGWIVSKWMERAVRAAMARAKTQEALGRFLGSIVRYAVLAATFIAALGSVGVRTTSVVAIFASAGLAVGLALQGSLANFAAGVMILFFRPFVLGDFVTAGGSTGTVHDIGIFATTLLTPNNETVIIANKSVTGATVTNYTRQGTRRGAIDVGVAYGSKLEEVLPILEKAAKRCDLVLEDPAPAVAFVSLGASSLDCKVFAWCQAADYLAMLHEVRVAVYDDLNAAGIEIPFQQIVVHQAEEAEDEKKAA